jgi:hypothetical protein
MVELESCLYLCAFSAGSLEQSALNRRTPGFVSVGRPVDSRSSSFTSVGHAPTVATYETSPAPTDTTPLPTTSGTSAAVPAWLHGMLRTNFFGPCAVHRLAKKNEVRHAWHARQVPIVVYVGASFLRNWLRCMIYVCT